MNGKLTTIYYQMITLCVCLRIVCLVFWDNYSKPNCSLAQIHVAYLWFEKCHFAHLRFVPLGFHNPPLLQMRIKMYFCSLFISLSSPNKKKPKKTRETKIKSESFVKFKWKQIKCSVIKRRTKAKTE